MTKNEKIDLLYSTILLLIGLLAMVVCKVYDFYWKWLSSGLFIYMITVLNLPQIIRRRKQYKKFEIMIRELQLSIEEIRELAGIGKYDLMDWKWDKSFIPPKKLYRLEDQLDQRYFKKFEKEFVLEKKKNVDASFDSKA